MARGVVPGPDHERSDAGWMRRALQLAERGRWTVSPNPLVGCVLVRDGQVVGEGWHMHAGGQHAEVVALAAAGRRSQGATAYVTLEPCAHHGRTGPCTRALVDAGVTRVVAAIGDPNAAAAGGAAALRAAGIRVDVGLLADEAARQNEVFLHGVATGRPFVTVKVATSLDGRIAAADGTSQWLTGAETRRRAHVLRAEADAVLVGSGTVLADDPRLTVRLDGYRGRQPLRVVLDGRGRTRPSHRVHDRSAPTLCVMAPDGDQGIRSVLAAAGVQVVVAADGSHGRLPTVLDALWERGVRSVLVEGGAGVAGAFVSAGLVDRLVVHVAPLLLGDEGRPAFADLRVATLTDARRWDVAGVQQVDGDVVLTCYPARTAAGRSVPAAEQVPARGDGDTATTLTRLLRPAAAERQPAGPPTDESTDELPVMREGRA